MYRKYGPQILMKMFILFEFSTVTRCPTPSKYVKWVILKRFATIFEIVFFGNLGDIDFVILKLWIFWRVLRCPPMVPHRHPDKFWIFSLVCFVYYAGPVINTTTTTTTTTTT